MEDPLASPLPAFGPEDARRILAEHFGVTAIELVPLAGERDQNFRVDYSYVLKISNPADGLGVLDMQVKALRHIERTDPGLPVMRVLPGEPVISGEDGRDYPVRLYTLVPGHATALAERTPVVLRRYGEVTARLGQALRGFFHPAAGYRTLWHLSEAGRLRELLPRIPDAASRAQVERVLDRYDARVAPVACVAALAVLDVIEDEGLIANAARTGEYLMSQLRGLGHPSITDVRGRGLLIGVEFAGSARPIVNALRHRGVLTGTTGPRDNVLKIRPPLVFTREQADLLLEGLSEAIDDPSLAL